MTKPIKNLIATSVIVVSVAGIIALVHYAPNKPLMFSLIDEKLQSIITPKPPLIGNLTPARDLRGVWKSSLSGKGLQIYGKFTVPLPTGVSITTVYEDGDVEIQIDSVENNIASGKIRFTNLCATATVTAPKIAPITTKQCQADSGYMPLSIRVSGSALDFGTTAVSGATVTMQGSYLTDIITVSMTADVPPYGVLKGVYNLNRQRQ